MRTHKDTKTETIELYREGTPVIAEILKSSVFIFSKLLFPA